MKNNVKSEKDYYSLFNDIQSDTDAYDVIPMNELDKKRMDVTVKNIVNAYPKQSNKQQSSKQLHKTHSCKWVAAACATLLVCGVMMTDAGSSAVYAAGERAAYHISNLLGIDRNLSDYATVIGTEQTDNGYTIRLNEVILDQSTLIVSTNVYQTDDAGNVGDELMMAIPIGDVYINGRSVASAAVGSSQYEENGNYLGALHEYHLKENVDTTGELDIKLVFQKISVQEGNILGEWEFHFVADGAMLHKDTLQIPLNVVVESENGATVTFSRYTGNILGERIYYQIDGALNKDVYLQGADDMGNEVNFITNVYDGNYAGTEGHGFMSLYDTNMITDETKSLTLTPYFAEDIVREDGKTFRGELKQAGEPFKIVLKP